MSRVKSQEKLQRIMRAKPQIIAEYKAGNKILFDLAIKYKMSASEVKTVLQEAGIYTAVYNKINSPEHFDENWARIKKELQAGATDHQICTKYKITLKTLTNKLKKKQYRIKRKVSEESKKEVIKLYTLTKKKPKTISKIIGISKQNVYNIINIHKHKSNINTVSRPAVTLSNLSTQTNIDEVAKQTSKIIKATMEIMTFPEVIVKKSDGTEIIYKNVSHAHLVKAGIIDIVKSIK